jgi:hypothetical protein
MQKVALSSMEAHNDYLCCSLKDKTNAEEIEEKLILKLTEVEAIE